MAGNWGGKSKTQSIQEELRLKVSQVKERAWEVKRLNSPEQSRISLNQWTVWTAINPASWGEGDLDRNDQRAEEPRDHKQEFPDRDWSLQDSAEQAEREYPQSWEDAWEVTLRAELVEEGDREVQWDTRGAQSECREIWRSVTKSEEVETECDWSDRTSEDQSEKCREVKAKSRERFKRIGVTTSYDWETSSFWGTNSTIRYR